MTQEQIIQNISRLPFENFSSKIFLQEIQRLYEHINSFGGIVLKEFENFENKFNEKQIALIIKKSQNSGELIRNLAPYLNEFQNFMNNFFEAINNFFIELENDEATLSGFKYRFMADSITIFSKANECQLFLIDQNKEDLKKVGKRIYTFSQEINDEILEERKGFLSIDEKKIEEELKQNKSKLLIFKILNKSENKFGLNKYFNSFTQKIKKEITDKIEIETYQRFDMIRGSIIQDILINKIKLDFIKKLDEYFIYLQRIESMIYNLEKELLNMIRELNKRLISLNQTIFEFINYILNEEQINNNIKQEVKNYISRIEKTENGLRTFSNIEENLNQGLDKLNKMLIANYTNFSKRIDEFKIKNSTDSVNIIKSRL